MSFYQTICSFWHSACFCKRGVLCIYSNCGFWALTNEQKQFQELFLLVSLCLSNMALTFHWWMCVFIHKYCPWCSAHICSHEWTFYGHAWIMPPAHWIHVCHTWLRGMYASEGVVLVLSLMVCADGLRRVVILALCSHGFSYHNKTSPGPQGLY